MTYDLHNADCLTALAALPAGSVHACCTSPPYYALRDYNTATWEGGDPACDHRSPTMRKGRNEACPMLAGSAASNSGQLLLAAWSACGKCGAVRVDRQIGLEASVTEYVAKMVEVFRAVHRVLRDDGTLWLNLGDTYANDGPGKSDPGPRLEGRANVKVPGKVWRGDGLKKGDLIGVPWRVAFALQADGWILRGEQIWAKPAPMPESVTNRCTKSHEQVFLFAKRGGYFYDADAIAEPTAPYRVKVPDGWDTDPGAHGSYHRKGRGKGVTTGEERTGRNKRDVWTHDDHRGLLDWLAANHPDTLDDYLAAAANKGTVWRIAGSPYPGAHFATFPPALVEPMVLAGTSAHGACGGCGEPYRRQTERRKVRRDRPNEWTKRTGVDGTGNSVGNGVAGVAVETTGWAVSCDCGPAAGVVPCVVLDPFAGTGTTGAVALEHGRRAVLIELSAANCGLIRERVGQVTPPIPWEG